MLRAAHDQYSEQMQAIGLRVNSREYVIFVPQGQAETDGHILARQDVRPFLFPAAQVPEVPVLSIPMLNGTAIPLA